MHDTTVGLAALVAGFTVAVSTTVAAVVADVGEWFQGGALIAGMLAAWRVMSRAHADAVDTYRTSAQDETTRLTAERARWDAERAALISEHDRLSAELDQIRRNDQE